jgi:dihydroxy-acid dehydratase
MAEKRLRSSHWYHGDPKNGFIHRSWMRRGNPDSAFTGKKPQIAVINTASDFNPCNMHLGELAQGVKNGIWESGGVPLEMPMISLGEVLMRPTASLWRNMAAMATEELIRANPIDGVVLLGGCDKTIPALLMGAISAGLPAIIVPGGPMLNGTFRGENMGCGTDVWKYSEEVRAGKMTQEEFDSADKSMVRSKGHCNTMGTASTMAAMAEALGMTLPGVAGTPAPDARLLEYSHLSGRRIVEMVAEELSPDKIINMASFHNAIVTLAGIGGSTNAVIHLLAIAGRLSINLTLEDFDRIGSKVPLLVNLKPAGEFLMEDLFRAGGLRAVLNELKPLLDATAIDVTGQPLVTKLEEAVIWDTNIIRKLAMPLQEEAGIVVLTGNLAPTGAVIKPAAASPHLLKHRGPAVVFENIEDLHARLDDPDLDITKDSVMVLRGCGPKGYPGMPEVSNMPMPKKILDQGITDMVRVCDGRMSGTAYGTVVLHVSPEAAAGGPLGLVQNGDIIILDVQARLIAIDISDEELAKRKPLTPQEAGYARPLRGYEKLYIDHVLQAPQGGDFDFLRGSSGSPIPRDSH